MGTSGIEVVAGRGEDLAEHARIEEEGGTEVEAEAVLPKCGGAAANLGPALFDDCDLDAGSSQEDGGRKTSGTSTYNDRPSYLISHSDRCDLLILRGSDARVCGFCVSFPRSRLLAFQGRSVRVKVAGRYVYEIAKILVGRHERANLARIEGRCMGGRLRAACELRCGRPR